ncbi:MAG: hypothetical protein WBC91_24320 [Phototrophicaceae bacterium]
MSVKGAPPERSHKATRTDDAVLYLSVRHLPSQPRKISTLTPFHPTEYSGDHTTA